MKTKRILTLLCAGVMLAGCSEVPEEVISREQSTAGESLAETASVGIETVPAASLDEELPDSAARIKAAGSENISFAESFSVNAGKAEQLGIYEAERRNDLTSRADEIFEAFFGSSFDSSAVKSRDAGGVTELSFEQDLTELHITDGFFYIVNKAEAERNLVFTNSDSLLALFEVRDIFKDERIKLPEGEATVGELTERLSGFLGKLKELGLGDCRPFTAASLSGEGRTQATAVLTYRRYFKGLPVFNFNYQPDGSPDAISYIYRDNESVSFVSAEKLFSAGFPSAYTEVMQTKALSEIISPEKAVETASRELAPKMKLTALRLDLVYVPTVPDGSEDGSRVTMRPYWQLAFGLQPLAEHYALIDAVSGKVIYCDASRG